MLTWSSLNLKPSRRRLRAWFRFLSSASSLSNSEVYLLRSDALIPGLRLYFPTILVAIADISVIFTLLGYVHFARLYTMQNILSIRKQLFISCLLVVLLIVIRFMCD